MNLKNIIPTPSMTFLLLSKLIFQKNNLRLRIWDYEPILPEGQVMKDEKNSDMTCNTPLSGKQMNEVKFKLIGNQTSFTSK